MQRATLMFAILLTTLAIFACGEESPQPTPTPRPAAIAAPTNTSAPTHTLTPSRTSTPTRTPLPDDTPTPEHVTARVLRVVDGDTIEVEIDGQSHTVRYIGMDTPERGDPFFEEATIANQRLVEGKVVELEKDVSETDRYGRLLRYVYMEGVFVNAELVRQGYARVATFPPDVEYQDLFLTLEREAREAERGLWAQLTATPTQTNTPSPTKAFTATSTPRPPTSTPSVTPTPLPDALVTAERLNVRSGPGTEYDIVGTLSQGDALDVTGRNASASWIVIVAETGTRGWVFAELVQLNVNVDQVPVVESPPTPTVAATPTQPPPTQPPAPAPTGNVVISRIFYDGVVRRVESDEYAEITNIDTTPVTLGGWRLNAGDPGQDFIFPDFVIQPGQSCRVYTNEHHPETCGFSFGSGRAIWNNKGDCGHLYNAAGTEVSQRCY